MARAGGEGGHLLACKERRGRVDTSINRAVVCRDRGMQEHRRRHAAAVTSAGMQPAPRPNPSNHQVLAVRTCLKISICPS